MRNNEGPDQVFSDIGILYELALTIGSSLNLKNNCEVFLRTLMSRKRFSSASIWLKSSVLPTSNESLSTEGLSPEKFKLVSSFPRVQIRERSLALEHMLWQRLQKEGAFSCQYNDPFFASLILESGIEEGVFGVFPIADMGFLKVHTNKRLDEMSVVELSKIATVLKKLATSLQGCIDHETLLLEITHRKQVELERKSISEKLQQAQKMEAIGRLASGIAHDFNNLLVGVLGNAELILHSNPDESEKVACLKSIITASERGAALTKQLLSFSRQEPEKEVAIHLNDLVEEVIALSTHSLNPNIKIETDLCSSCDSVMGSPTQLQTVVLNLVVNALDSMPNGGLLSIKSSAASEAEIAELVMKSENDNRIWLRFSVQDSGSGIPVEVLSKIFEPFFTTKTQGHGTGLGLSMAYGTIQQHGGHITVESRVGHGTCFNIYLPAKKPEVSWIKDTESRILTGQGLVLFIDDDDDIRRAIVEMARYCGYQVLEAGDGLSGVAVVAEYFQQITAVVVDLKMPGLSGVDTVRKLRALCPSLKILIASGYGEEGDINEVKKLGVETILQKPFRLSVLAEVLAEVHKPYKD